MTKRSKIIKFPILVNMSKDPLPSNKWHSKGTFTLTFYENGGCRGRIYNEIHCPS